MFSKHTKKQGFSLIELVVVTAILAVITGVVLVNLNRGAKNDDLRRAAAEVTAVLRKAQNLALIGSQQNIPPGAINTGKFGVHFDSAETNYVLFLDFSDGQGGGANGQYELGEGLVNYNFFLPQDIVIDSFNPVDDVLDIVFVPPKPDIYFNNSTDNTSTTIILKQNQTNKTRTIKVNRLSGQISIED